MAGHLHPVLGIAARLVREPDLEVRVLSTAAALPSVAATGAVGVELLAGADAEVAEVVDPPYRVGSNPRLLVRQLRATAALQVRLAAELREVWGDDPPDLVLADFTMAAVGPTADALGLPWWTTHPSPARSRRGAAPGVRRRVAPRPGAPGTGAGRGRPAVRAGLQDGGTAAGGGAAGRRGAPVALPGGRVRGDLLGRAGAGAGAGGGRVPAGAPGRGAVRGAGAAHAAVLASPSPAAAWPPARAGDRRDARGVAPGGAGGGRFPGSRGAGVAGRGAAPEPGSGGGRAADRGLGARRAGRARRRRLLPDLARFDAVVHHGGSGVLGHTLAAGLPAVVWPVDYDQPDHAVRLVDAGVAVRLERPERLAEEVLRVLEEPGFAAAARAIAADIAARPAVETITAAVRARLGV
ncbi:glycosyltransferase [Nocardioides zeae]